MGNYSDDLTTDVLKRVQNTLPKWTQMRVLSSSYLANGAAGSTSRENIEIDDEDGGLERLVAVDIEVAAIPSEAAVGGGVILSPSAITNATIASADGTNSRVFIPIPPYHGGATDAFGCPPSFNRIIFPEPITFSGSGLYCYLVANTLGSTPIAATVTLYEDRPDKTFPKTIATAFAEQADV